MTKEFKPTPAEMEECMKQVDNLTGGMDNVSKKSDELHKSMSGVLKGLRCMVVGAKVMEILGTIAEAKKTEDGFKKKGLTAIRTSDDEFYIMKGAKMLVYKNNITPPADMFLT